MRVQQVSLDKPFEYFLPGGAAMMIESLAMIHISALPPMIFLSKLEWKQRDNWPNSELKASRDDVTEVENN